MDPLSAVGLAGTVVQFLDFSIKLVAKAQEIYQSAEGAEDRNIDLEATAQSLRSINHRLRNRTKIAFKSAVTEDGKDGLASNAASEDERALEAMIERCDLIAKELLDALTKAKIQGIHTRWKSIRQALKSVLGRDKIQELYKRLKLYREQVVILLLVIISTKQTTLDENVQDVKQNITESEIRILNDAQRSRTQILGAIERFHYHPNKPEDVASVSELLSSMNAQTSAVKNHEIILNSLYFPRMKERREWITEAHAKTFNWALEGKLDGQTPWPSLSKWLEGEDGIYWMSGKAGSGKSTLMKYIEQDRRTRKYLEHWASSKPLVMASFYFWNPGTSMQNSQLGLLQSLLYEILSKEPSLISKIFNSRWYSIIPKSMTSFTWPVSELLDAVKHLADAELNTKFCFIIDGLDEFDGDHRHLVDSLFRLTRTSNIKILASSRPWLIFQDAFEHSPKLILQDLTHEDIKMFTHDSLYNHPKFKRLLASEPDQASKLVSEVVYKASGVFLWVYLVVRSLMEGLTNADRIGDLQRRLHELPTDLEQYFLHILTGVDAFYFQQASQFFRIAIEAQKPLSVLTYSYIDEPDPNFALKDDIREASETEEAERCESMERRLNSRCRGLLEIRCHRVCDEYSNSEGVVAARISYDVDFLHRTVRDFLNSPTVRVRLVAPDTADFNANMKLASAFVAQIKALRRTSHAESNFQALWNLVFDAMTHLSRIQDGVLAKAQVALLEELDRAAAHFRSVAIVKRRADPLSHWVNTGYRFGLNPKWNNDLLTLCLLYDVFPYVQQYVPMDISRPRPGRPLLAFTITKLQPENYYIGKPYMGRSASSRTPPVKIVKLLLERGADPNERDEEMTIWETFLLSMYYLACTAGSEFHDRARDWFEATKLMISHGATLHSKHTINVPAERLQRRLTVTQHKIKASGAYSASEMVRTVFHGSPTCDFAELEDLMDIHDSAESLSQMARPPPSPSHLEVPQDTVRPRAGSQSSVSSQASAASWRRPTPQDVVINASQTEDSTIESIPQASAKQKVGYWFQKKKLFHNSGLKS